MKHLNINFVKKKEPGKQHVATQLILYGKGLHLSVVDASVYHILALQSISAGIIIVALVLSEKSLQYLTSCAWFVRYFLAATFGIIKIALAVVVWLPFLFFVFCIRVGIGFISQFALSFFEAAEEQITRMYYSSRKCLERGFHAFAVDSSFFSPRSYALPAQLYRRIAAFLFIAAFLIFPIIVFGTLAPLGEAKKETAFHIQSGLQQFLSGANTLSTYNSAMALQEFRKSAQSFQSAESALGSLGSHALFIARLLPFTGRKVQDAERLIRAGQEFSAAGAYAAQAVSLISSIDAFGQEKITRTLSELEQGLGALLAHLESGEQKLVLVDASSMPSEFAEKFTELKKEISTINNSLRTAQPLVRALPVLLGIHKDQRYLIVLQNNSEIRPTGGFMGSFALVDVKKGAVKKMEIPSGGTYDVQGQLRKWLVSPWPLHLINARWEFQDANWFADFPASARKIKWFYENAGGPTIDGVIAINASFAEKLLSIIGQVEIKSFNKTVRADNFFDIIQKSVELEYDKKQNSPKKFLGEFIQAVSRTIEEKSSDKGSELFLFFLESILSKEIQVYSSVPDIQEILETSGLSGSIARTSGDYLMIIDTNIGGRKTDMVMDRKADYSVRMNSEGELDATLTITSGHNGKRRDYFIGAKNINYIRFYTPPGSVLLSAEGFSPPPRSEFESPPLGAVEDLDLARIQGPFTADEKTGMIVNHEFNKTVFSNWIQTDVGETSRVRISYRLPFTLSRKAPYSLFIQRQSGSVYKKINIDIVGAFRATFEPFTRDEFIQLPFILQ